MQVRYVVHPKFISLGSLKLHLGYFCLFSNKKCSFLQLKMMN